MKFTKPILTASAALALLTGAAQAGHLNYYSVNLATLNGSGVTGSGALVYDSDLMQLSVSMSVTGLFPLERHAAHIHGIVGGDSKTPDMTSDADGDGFIEVLEAAPNYGDIMLSLTDPETGMFEQAPKLGEAFVFDYVYDLSVETDGDPDNDILAGLFGEYTLDEFGPEMLENREIVFHGDRVLARNGIAPGEGTDGEIDGTTGYKPLLPVAAGEIVRVDPPAAVPLPAGLPLLALGLGALAWQRRRRGA